MGVEFTNPPTAVGVGARSMLACPIRILTGWPFRQITPTMELSTLPFPKFTFPPIVGLREAGVVVVLRPVVGAELREGVVRRVRVLQRR